MPPNPPRKNIARTCGSLLLLLTLTALFLWPLPLGRLPASGDLADVFLPLEYFYHREIKAGRLPLWSPWVGEGYPVYASAQLSFWSPFLFPFHLLPPPLAIALALFSACFAAAAAMFFLLRRWYGYLPSLLGAAVFAFSGWTAAHLTHLNILSTLPFFPLLIWQADAYLRRPRASLWLFAAVLLALALIGGQPQITAYAILTWLYWLSWGAARAWGWRSLLKKILPGAAGAGLLAGGLAAVQLLPLAELTQQSVRGGGLDPGRAYQYSLLPHQWITFFFPNFYSRGDQYFGPRLAVEAGLYLGVIPLWLALTIWWRRRKVWPEKAWGVLAAAGILLALGWASPLRLAGIEPSLGVFTAPARWSLLTIFSLSALAASGLQACRSSPRSFRKTGITLLLLLFFTALAATLLLRPAEWWQSIARFAVRQWLLPHPSHVLPETYYLAKFNSLLTRFPHAGASLLHWRTLLPLAVLAAALVSLRPPKASLLRSPLAAVLLLLALTDLLAATQGQHVWAPVQKLVEPPPTARFLAQKSNPFRIFSIRPPTDSGKIFTNPPPHPKRLREEERLLLLPARHSIWLLAGTTWNAALPLKTQWQAEEELARSGLPEKSKWFTLHGVTHVLVTPRQSSANIPPNFRLLGTVRGETFPEAVVQIWENPAPASPYYLFPAQGEIKLLQKNPQLFVWQISTAQPAWFFVRDSYYPGWRAFIDGKQTTILRSSAGHRVIRLPAGTHRVRMEYRPASWRLGLQLSMLSLLLLPVLALTLRKATS